MSVGGLGPTPLPSGADYDRTANPTELNAGFGVNSRDLMWSAGASRALTNNLAVGVDGGMTHLTAYGQQPRGFVGANVTNHFNNPYGVDPYLSANYRLGFGPGGVDHTVGGKLGVTAPLSDRFNMGMFIGTDRTLGNGPTAGWSTHVGMTVGFRIK
jgi:hypothetical protein